MRQRFIEMKLLLSPMKITVLILIPKLSPPSPTPHLLAARNRQTISARIEHSGHEDNTPDWPLLPACEVLRI